MRTADGASRRSTRPGLSLTPLTLDRHQGQKRFHHLGTNTIHGIEVLHGSERAVLLPPFDNAFGQDGADLGQGVELLGRRGIEVDFSTARSPGSRATGCGRTANWPRKL